jgi:membrane protein YqaA with SNARE-associated domain
MEINDRIVSEPAIKTASSRRLEKIIIFLEVAMVLALLGVWIGSPAIRQSKNLWVLFFYNFPSQFLVAVVPHEPVFIYFSKFHSPIVVTAVAIVGTLLTEYVNYSVFRVIADLKALQKFSKSSMIQRAIRLFGKAPFAALLFAGFTPFPFYPFRFLVVISHYPLSKYLLAVFLSRTPRFLILALLGNKLKIPDAWIAAIFAVCVVIIYVPLLRASLLKRKKDPPVGEKE